MPEVTRRRQGELIRGIFSLLLDQPEGLPAKKVLDELERVVPPTEFEAGQYPNRPGVRRFEKIVRFASIPAVKAGWLLKRKGTWLPTQDGRDAYTRYRDPEAFFKQAVQLYLQWRRFQPITVPEGDEEAPEPGTALEEAEEAAWTEIQEYLQEMPPYEFQDLVASLLRAMGYHVAWVAPPGKDSGIDILAFSDPLGTSLPRIKVQVKRRTDKVAVDGLRAFMALLGDDDVGIFVSTGGFTADAEQEARANTRRTTLLDLSKVVDLWIEYYEKIFDRERQRLPLKPVYYLAPTE
ncbi:MAG: restriction endonuclease [Armatimonadota bacterium]|nr:restriction endonuclease [Armatimonadota bacterium]MDR7573961.1 restriction endonuclease [Armatimonadota bacterium]